MALSVETILATHTAEEIAENIERLKKEMKNLYSSASAGGRSGNRSVELVREDLEAFAAAKQARDGTGGGMVSVQATWGGN